MSSHCVCKVLLKACAFFITVSCATAYCQQGWVYYSVTHSCFHGSTDKNTYVEGREYCRNQSSFVASIRNTAAETFLYDNGVVVDYKAYYLGSFNGSATWDDGTPIENANYKDSTLNKAFRIMPNPWTIQRSLIDYIIEIGVLCEKDAVAICSNITDVVVNTKNTTEGTVVTYKCPQGSWFSSAEYGASATTTCQNSTAWLPAVRSCHAITCNVTAVTQGTSNVSSALNFSEVVRYTCNNGYEIPGGLRSQDLTCRIGTITPIPCQVVTCNVTANANGSANTSSLTYGQTVEFTCTQGYWFSDNTTSKQAQCISGDVSFSGCSIVTCDVAANVNGSANTSSLTYGQTVEFTCTQGYRFSDNTTSKQAQCISGDVSSSGCSIITCSVPTGVLSTENATGSTVNYGETVRYTCNLGNQFSDGSTDKDYTCGSSGTISVAPCQGGGSGDGTGTNGSTEAWLIPGDGTGMNGSTEAWLIPVTVTAGVAAAAIIIAIIAVLVKKGVILGAKMSTAVVPVEKNFKAVT